MQYRNFLEFLPLALWKHSPYFISNLCVFLLPGPDHHSPLCSRKFDGFSISCKSNQATILYGKTESLEICIFYTTCFILIRETQIVIYMAPFPIFYFKQEMSPVVLGYCSDVTFFFCCFKPLKYLYVSLHFVLGPSPVKSCDLLYIFQCSVISVIGTQQLVVG